jgi:putative ABC transport system ATP-binding protein
VLDPVLAAHDVSLTYGSGLTTICAIQGLSLEFTPGTMTLVMGPSGCGKTSLLSVLGCLLTPNSGRVYIQGQEVSRLTEREKTVYRRQTIGFVFQAFRLFKSLSALENVSLAAELTGTPRIESIELARQRLDEFHLGSKLHMTPDQLSGGERQRVAIARALVKNPAIILADEPTASLDFRAGQQIGDLLSRLAAEQGKVVVVVTHDYSLVALAHRFIGLQDGRIVHSSD